MKTNFISKIHRALRRKVVGVGSSMYSLGGDLKVSIKPFISEIWRIARICFKGDIGNRIRLFNNFYVQLRIIEKNHGTAYAIKYLKANQVAIQRVLAKTPYKSLRELEPDLPFPRLYSGLPSIIPLNDRRYIRSGHLGVIRYWLSVFGIFRVLKGPIKSKIDTIIDPFSGKEDALTTFNDYCNNNLWILLRSLKFSPEKIKVASDSFANISSSGPNGSFAKGSVLTDLWWFIKDPQAYNNFQLYAKLSDSHLGYLMDKYIKLTTKACLQGATIPIKGRFLVDGSIHKGETLEYHGDKYHFWSPYSNLALKFPSELRTFVGGQLSFKEEAAGKLRIFAMVDIWTQSILKPLHESIYLLLSSYIPNDGTSNQEAAFKRVLEKTMKYGCAWSVDLSSATDRLPISIQSNLVSRFTKIDGIGDAWKNLLVDRDYLITGSPEKLKSYGLSSRLIRYSVGQPMGALSSFAMLGLTHHMIVQYAVYNVRGNQTVWYDAYEIVGDDIVLFEHDIYTEYIRLLAEFGVPANPAKSIPSPSFPSAEFLKRTAYNGKDVSPISWKELLQGNSLPGRVNLLLRLVDRSLVHNSQSVKAVLCRFGSELKKDLKPFAQHGIVSVISSLSLRRFRTLYPSLLLLLDPKMNPRGGNDYVNITIPQRQVMKLLENWENVHSTQDFSNYISHWDSREHIAQRGLTTMMSKDAVKTALELLYEVRDSRPRLIADFAKMLICLDNHRIDDSKDKYRGLNLFPGIDYRPIKLNNDLLALSTRILIGSRDDLEERIALLERKHFRAPVGGIPLDEALALLDKTTAYCSKFSLEKVKPGFIPEENKVSLMAILAQRRITPAWESFLDFHNYYKDLIRRPRVSTTRQVPNTLSEHAGSRVGTPKPKPKDTKGLPFVF